MSFMKNKTDKLGVCSKCRWRHGCESCNYEKSLKMVMRKHDVPSWWLRTEGAAMRKLIAGRAVPINVKKECIYTYTYTHTYRHTYIHMFVLGHIILL